MNKLIILVTIVLMFVAGCTTTVNFPPAPVPYSSE